MKMRLLRSLLPVLTIALLASGCLAQDAKPADSKEDYVKAHYTKYEYRIPMRDGVRLFTSRLRAQGPVAALSHSDGPHALQRRALRRRPVQEDSRALGRVRESRLHLRLPGRARPLSVRRQVRRDARRTSTTNTSPQDVDDSSRHVRHHRIPAQARGEQQRQGRHLGHFLSRASIRRPASSTRIPP